MLKIFKLTRLIRGKSIKVILLVLFFTANGFALVNQVKADVPRSTSYYNLFSITDASTVSLMSNGKYKCSMPSGIVGNFFENFPNEFLSIKLSSGICRVIAENPTESIDPSRVKAYIEEEQGDSPGMLNMISTANAFLLDQKTASGRSYVEQQVYAITHPTQTVYAAEGDDPGYYTPGTGYSLLRPVQAFWGWSVNIVYGLLVLVIIFVAFGIMFRNRLGGGATITLQNAIPSIAMAMILVPMSYAITGFFIDIMVIGTNAAHEFILGPGSPARDVYTNRNDISSIDDSKDRGLHVDDERVNWFNIRNMVDYEDEGEEGAEALLTSLSERVGIAGTIVDVVANVLNVLPGEDRAAAAWFGSILNFILSIIMIYTGLKIFWFLLKKYMIFLIMPIFAPFIFATIAIPGNGTKSLMDYIKTLGAASTAYIVTYAMFLLTIVFSSTTFQESIPAVTTNSFIPPMLGITSLLRSTTAEAGGTTVMHLLLAVVSLGIYFSIPSTLESINKAFGVKESLPAFLTTPWKEFNESRKVTWQYARGVVPTALEATRITAKNAGQIKTIANNWNTPAKRATTLVQNWRDKRRGLTPGEQGTWSYRQGQEFGGRLADAKQREAIARRRVVDNPNDREAQRALREAQGDIAGIQGEAEKRGIRIGPAEADKPESMSAKFTWAENPTIPGLIIFTRGKIDSIVSEYDKTHTPYETFPIGKLVLEAQNFEFLPGSQIEYSAPDMRPGTSDVQFGSSLGLVQTGAEVFGRPKLGAGAPNDLVTLYVSREKDPLLIVDRYNPAERNKVIQVKMTLRIENPLLFFHGADANNNPLDLSARQYLGIVKEAYNVVFEKRMFRIANTGWETAKDIDVLIKVDKS